MRSFRLRPRVSVLAVVATLIVTLAVPAIADDAIEEEPEYIGASVNYTPLSWSDGAALVTVRLVGDPVALEQARAGRKLDRAEKDQIKARLKADQDALAGEIAALGGTIESQLQSAINAMRVRIPQAQLAALAGLPGVVGIHPVELMVPANTSSVQYIGTPLAWQTTGFRGEGIKVGIIDTGIDYMHANFGGPGTHGSYAAFDRKDTREAAPGIFGSNGITKVKGGTDLVGDNYNASSSDPAQNTPQPDPNPLDCNGHGSHVAGTAAGFGVLSGGKTYKGTYDTTTYSANQFRIGPGVAPLADLYAIRVFGCSGSTAVTTDAIDWAVDNDMDVINMSLGSNYGRADNASSIAADNAAAAGILVIASSGNAGTPFYITGSPASGLRAISVAANDSTASFPGATLTLSTSNTVTAINANGATFADGTTWPVKVLRNADGSVSLGCNDAEYTDVVGKIVVSVRGVCARVARAVFAQKAGAAAALMINNSTALPPFEGPITGNPDTGEQLNVTIPFFGVRGLLNSTPPSDGDKVEDADGGSLTAVNTLIANPGFTRFASFTSQGPRIGDSTLKPDITAPGVSIQSTEVGTGDGGFRNSGTSMSAPHVTGVAALVKQAHPDWSQDDLRAAIVSTADPTAIGGYRTSRGGAGLVQPFRATRTSAVAQTSGGVSALNFGFSHVTGSSLVQTKAVTVKNNGSTPITFAASSSSNAPFSRTHTLSLSSSSLTVPAGDSATLNATLTLLSGNAGTQTAFNEVAGFIGLSPAVGQNNDVKLVVPYYLVPRVASAVTSTVAPAIKKQNPSNTFTISNPSPNGGTARFFTWGISDPDDAGVDWYDLRAVGVRGFNVNIAPPGAPPVLQRRLEFAFNTWERHSTASTGEYDVHIDNNGDGITDLIGFGADLGLVTQGAFNGTYASFVFNLATNTTTALFLATAPTDQSTVILTFRASDLGLNATTKPRFTYRAVAFNFRGGDDNVLGETGKFNAFTPAINTPGGTFNIPAGSAGAPVNTMTNAAEWDLSTPKGVMLVYLDNAAGAPEAQTVAAE